MKKYWKKKNTSKTSKTRVNIFKVKPYKLEFLDIPYRSR